MKPLACLATVLLAVPAHAEEGKSGALSEVVHGIHNATSPPSSSPPRGGGGDSQPSNSPPPPPTSSHDNNPDPNFVGHHHTYPYTTGGGAVAVGYYAGYPPPAATATSRSIKTSLDLYGGLQRVSDSDGALSADLRLTFDELGVGARITTFFERNGPSEEWLTLHLWGVTGSVFIVDRPDLRVMLEGGLSGLDTAPNISLLGPGGGASVRAPLMGQIAAFGDGRFSYFTEGSLRVIELAAGVDLGPVRLGYRAVDFSVGPTLHGPEVGLCLHL
jgi:hypothetical protein